MAKKELVNNAAVTLRVNSEPAEKVADILSEAEGVIEETLDVIENTAEKVVTVTRNNPVLIGAALVVGLGIGGVIGYKIAIKRLETKYESLLDEQVAEVKSFYKRANKAEEFSTPASAVEVLVPTEAGQALSTYQGRETATPYNRPETVQLPEEPTVVVEETTIVQHNVFVDNPDPLDWDLNHEIATRDTTQPYVIDFTEFASDEEGHEKVSLTYYVEDDTLTDERSVPIDTVDATVGEDNLLRFGAGSHDENVVYIRNERLDTDFEVTRSAKSYQEDVLGLPAPERELRHAHRPRRMRETDE